MAAVRKSITDLQFDNSSLRLLPVEDVPVERGREQRQVPNACFSRVPLSPVANPTVVGISQAALDLLDIDDSHPDFPLFFSGSKHIPGSQPAAHCYCGHQFGNFAGQLGDGAAMYLGEVINAKGKRWELQIKGGGMTPYSRAADGRKVLRSSLREFLCSEAMYYLGVPTTRAGSLITSDDKVVRDIHYDGNEKLEACSVITRISPTFLRFGSFEICKAEDPTTGRAGPSAILGLAACQTLLRHLTQHVCTQFFSGVGVEDMFREVVRSTAYLVAKWQSIGWCHGVLNTDNMSILGLTIDYGPFGFMEYFDEDYICNGSDGGGRYRYAAQPSICKWNLRRFAEALEVAYPNMRPCFDSELALYDDIYNRHYYSLMGRKLGIVTGFREAVDADGRVQGLPIPDKADAAVVSLVDGMMACMKETFADFTKVLRCLSAHDTEDALVNTLVGHCASAGVAVDTLKSRGRMINLMFHPSQLQAILQHGPVRDAIADETNNEPKTIALREEQHKLKMLINITETIDTLQKETCTKPTRDSEIWRPWVKQYLAHTKVPGAKEQMESMNPVFILHQWKLQQIVEACEKGDYQPLHRAVKRIQTPYTEDLEYDSQFTATPSWAPSLCVTCSS